MGRKKKNIIIIICVLSIVIVYFLINFLIWGIVPPKKKIYFLNNEVSLKYERKKRNNGIISVVYKDSAGNDYIFDRNGKLTGYYDVGGGADFPGYDAARELIRYSFEELHMEKLWCGYFDGNEKSRRSQEKCGFLFHHTNENIHWELMNDTRTEHINCMTKEQWEKTNTQRVQVKS